MGTNFCMQKKPCCECGLTPPEVHLGKRSAGWQYHARGYRAGDLDEVLPNATVHSLVDLFDMIGRLINKGWHIEDEYGTEYSVDYFKTAVELTKTWNGSAAKSPYWDGKARGYDMSDDAIDDEGWSVCYREFS